MDKKQFLEELREHLSGLPKEDIDERLCFYSEMIDDRVEEGMSESEAIKQIGSAEKIAAEIVAEIPLGRLVKEQVKKRPRLRTWEIVLLAVGSPIWLSLLIAAVAVIFSLYAACWAIVISFWAVGVSLAASAVAGTASVVGFFINHNVWAGIVMLGACLILGGLSIFWIFGCEKLTNGVIALTKAMLRGIKYLFVGRRNEA